jgi:hypothetical protein
VAAGGFESRCRHEAASGRLLRKRQTSASSRQQSAGQGVGARAHHNGKRLPEVGTTAIFAMSSPKRCSFGWKCSENREVFQQRNDADDDDDNLGDLFGPRIERKAADEIENEHNDQKRNQDADEN